jgi:hypothetical protein
MSNGGWAMKNKLLIMLVALVVIIGLLFLAAYSGSMAKEKKRPTAIPSISIDPYRIPLPIMEHNVKVAIRLPIKAK